MYCKCIHERRGILERGLQNLIQKCNLWSKMVVQGEWTQTVKSNLDLTERKHAINFNLKVGSDQGRLDI